MPREYTHWTVLEQALSESIPMHSENRSVLAAAYLGAMLPDLPDFYRGGFGDSKGEQIAAYLHGVYGQDPLDFVRELVALLPDKQEPDHAILVGLIIGYTSHIVVDSIFHPLVLYLCGDWYAKDDQSKKRNRARHRLLETYLDIWAMKNFDFEFKHGLRSAVGYLTRKQQDSLLAVVAKAYCRLELPPQLGNEKKTKAFFKTSLSHTIWLQETFRSGLPGKAISLLLKKLNRTEMSTLFHNGKHPELSWFQKQWDYNRVISGEPCRGSFFELLEKSISVSKGWFSQLSGEIYENKRSVLLSAKGPSLDCGEINGDPEQYKHFSSSPPLYLEE